MFTHGLRYPESMHAAKQTADGVSEGGATPVFAGVIDGTLRVGLTHDEMETLTQKQDVVKAAARDMPFCMSRALSAGTTLSAALSLATRAGINVIATGAMGGVSWDYNQSLDASTDITELGRRRALVVCSGTTPTANPRKTLEMLETLGVPVIGYQTSEFPGFFCASTDEQLEHRLDTPEEVIDYYKYALRCGLNSSVLICVPVPEEVAIARDAMDEMIVEAGRQANALDIRGKALFPFLLTALEVLSGGKTRPATMGLLKHNAFIGGRMASILGGSH
jgi:pseudouridine-5'-phosphate glycosidase